MFSLYLLGPDEEFSAVTENITQHPSPNCTINHLDFDCDNHFCPWFIENDNISPLQSVDTNSVYTPQANTPLSSFSEATPQASRKRKNNQRKDKGNIRRRHVAEWKDNKRKMLRNLGKEYESRDGTVRCGKSWSDNCVGQNRNRIVYAMYMQAAIMFQVTIHHCFLEVGHTQNEGDSVHALIEKSAKNELIYTPTEWFCLVRWAKQKGKPYIVEELQYTDFFN